MYPFNVPPSIRTNPPTLSHLIHETVYAHRFKLLSQKNEKKLGKCTPVLMNGIRNFITLMDWLIDDYENNFFLNHRSVINNGILINNAKGRK